MARRLESWRNSSLQQLDEGTQKMSSTESTAQVWAVGVDTTGGERAVKVQQLQTWDVML